MRVRVHPRVTERHPELSEDDVLAAFDGALRSVPREGSGFPPRWVGVGLDGRGRLLQWLAAQEEVDDWLVYHAMPVTTKVLIEVGLRR